MTDSLQPPPLQAVDLSFTANVRRRTQQDNALAQGLRASSGLLLRAHLRAYHRLQIVGREQLPRAASFVMVANHASHLDALCLRAAIPLFRLHRTFALAAQNYFFANLRHLLPAIIFANAIPFERARHLRKNLRLCRDILATPGSVLILFPEGTRTTTGEMGAFRSGVGMLVAGTDVPVVPCAIQGSFRALRKGAMIPRPYGVRMVIGRPRHYGNLPAGRESSDCVAHDLHAAVRELLCR